MFFVSYQVFSLSEADLGFRFRSNNLNLMHRTILILFIMKPYQR